MTEYDKPQFAEILGGVLQVYGTARVTPIVLSIWWEALKEYDLKAIEQALFKHVKDPDEGQFSPKPANIEKFIGGNSDDKALIAWALVNKSIAEIGAHNSVVFPDPLIHAVIEGMGGWPTLCRTEKDELPYRANEFAKRYRGFLRIKPTSWPKSLVGISEAANLSGGQEVDPPLLAGDRDQCLLVWKGGSKRKQAPVSLENLKPTKPNNVVNIKEIGNVV